jgi:hypothetical protein
LSRRSEARKELKPYKSKFEKEFHEKYPKLKYEVDYLVYTVDHKYNPDFKVKEGVYIETKGLFTATDRAKHLYVREQYPDIKIYLVFQNPNNRLSRVSRTTYGEWCTKHGIGWTTLEAGIPPEWLDAN